MTRKFSPRCGACRQTTMVLAVVDYQTQVHYEGAKHQVHVPDLSVPKCVHCGALSFDAVACEQVDAAGRHVLALLTPDQIAAGRNRLGMSAADLAIKLGVREDEVDRWENGHQLQPSAMDRLLRALFSEA